MTAAHVDGPATASGDPYRALLAVSEAIVSHRDLSALFHELAGRLHQVVRFDYLALLLHEAASNTLRLHVLEPSEPALPSSVFAFPVGETPAELVWQTQQPLIISGVAEQRRWPRVPGTSAAVWSPEFLPAAADHRPAAAGHAGVRLQAAVRLRRGRRGLPATRRQSGGRGRRERPGLPGDRGGLQESDRRSPRRRPTWRRRSAPSTTSARSSARAPPCAGSSSRSRPSPPPTPPS